MKNSVMEVLTLKNISAWTKRELTDLASASAVEVAEKGEDVLSLIALAAKLEHFAGEVKKAAKDVGINDLAKYGKEGVAKSGVKLILKETGVSYNYSRDEPWVIRNEEAEGKKALLKEWENFLMGLPRGGMVITDPDTGAEYHAYPPVRSAKESIQATIL